MTLSWLDDDFSTGQKVNYCSNDIFTTHFIKKDDSFVNSHIALYFLNFIIFWKNMYVVVKS